MLSFEQISCFCNADKSSWVGGGVLSTHNTTHHSYFRVLWIIPKEIIANFCVPNGQPNFLFHELIFYAKSTLQMVAQSDALHIIFALLAAKIIEPCMQNI